MRFRDIRISTDAIGGVTVAGIAALIYIRLLRPGVWFSDLGEFALIPAYLGRGHWPGYPVPNIIYYLAHMGGSNPAVAAGVINALFGVAAAALLYTAARVIDVRRALAAPLALAFAFASAVWEESTGGPEVYNIELFSAALFLVFALLAVKRADPRFSIAAVFILGLALGNRPTFLAFAPLLLPGVILIPHKRLGIAAAVLMLGFSTYFYLACRSFHFGDYYGCALSLNIRGAWEYATLIFRHPCFGGFNFRNANIAAAVCGHLIFQAKYSILIFSFIGCAAWVSRYRKRGIVMLISLLATLLLFIWIFVAYAAIPVEPYLLIPLLLIFFLAANGAEAAAAFLSRLQISIGWAKRPAGAGITPSRYFGISGIVVAVMTATSIYQFLKGYSHADRRGDGAAHSYAAEVYARLPLEATAGGDHYALMPMAYFRWVRGSRPDVTLSSIDPSDWRCFPDQVNGCWVKRYGPRQGPFPKPSANDAIFYLNSYPGIEACPHVREYVVPGLFLGRLIKRVPADGYFVTVIGDYPPLCMPYRGLKKGYAEKNWATPTADCPTRWKPGIGTFLVGKRTGTGMRVFAQVIAGAQDRKATIPAVLNPPTAKRFLYGFRGDPYYGFDSLYLEVDHRRYTLPSSGIIFLAYDQHLKNYDLTSYYSADKKHLLRIFEYTP